MVDINDFARRIKRRSILSGTLFFGGALLMFLDFRSKLPMSAKGEMAVVWLMVMGIGAYFWYRSLELPMTETMQLAEQHKGLLTVGEIATALAVSPDIASRTLRQLQARGLARVSMLSLDKNLWEFPDATRLPITQAIQIARDNDGYLSVADLISAGIALETAQQTVALLEHKGVLKQAQASDLHLPPAETPGDAPTPTKEPPTAT